MRNNVNNILGKLYLGTCNWSLALTGTLRASKSYLKFPVDPKVSSRILFLFLEPEKRLLLVPSPVAGLLVVSRLSGTP